ncbi:cytochrome-c peroxidase [Ancylobacter sp. FA202]|uniref:cytochrome-c peroxidase n=1 Tax=Ancylobacter sp. FA202 TaxID=1111106 RepID=UPI001FD88259|nr:cytochrome c peroxidase [Ancylobacter sp. FA202]
MKSSMAILATLIALLPLASMGWAEEQDGPDKEARVRLGEALFFDVDLSRHRTQSCATCHDPAQGFADPRGGPVSLGDDGVSRGVRNAPSVSYAGYAPAFGTDAKGNPVGGQFWDGRAATLADQAGQPLLNPVEMAMPNKASVVARLKEKPGTFDAFRATFGPDVFDDDTRAFAALTQALAAYEQSTAVSPFDSRYDRYLRGTLALTPQEELGRVLFFSNQFTNCGQCHKLTPNGGEGETFSNYRFHNIGTPANPELAVPADRGLAARADIKRRKTGKVASARAHDGQFKVPSLRNVAVTGPYMHNGVFNDLRTVILFYNKYNSAAPGRQINPETGEAWDPPEVAGTLSLKELESGPALDDRRIDALVAFLKTLTDQRLEPLLEPPAAAR